LGLKVGFRQLSAALLFFYLTFAFHFGFVLFLACKRAEGMHILMTFLFKQFAPTSLLTTRRLATGEELQRSSAHGLARGCRCWYQVCIGAVRDRESRQKMTEMLDSFASSRVAV
jgi:hypothetical protein